MISSKRPRNYLVGDAGSETKDLHANKEAAER